MDIRYFLLERTKLICRLYDTAGQPFRETMRKIDEGEEPFVPRYSEYDEPPFLTEWLDADTSLDLLGRACLSMLSASLQLYFKEWEKWLRIDCGDKHKGAFKDGFLSGYRACFESKLGIDWSECPVDFAILEQVTLARNRDQHPDSITTWDVPHSDKDKEKFPRPFFTDEFGETVSIDPTSDDYRWFAPKVHVTREKLFEAIRQVEVLAEWFQKRVWAVLYGDKP